MDTEAHVPAGALTGDGLVAGAGVPGAPSEDAAWDAGPMGCGELVMELRFRMQDLRPGQVLLLTALDTGAVEDIPAWCRMTGHGLARAEHPRYWIRRREG